MPAKNQKLLVNLDLLHPQSSPERLLVKLLRWLLSSGRYMFIFVEALVLIAFIARFKLDADLANRKEEIEEQKPFIESLKPYEILIRQTHLKISAIQTFYASIPNYPEILKKIADQTPLGITILSLNLEKSIGKVTINIIAQAQTNADLSNFIFGLKDAGFTSATLTSIGLEQGTIRFAITLDAQTQGGEQSL